MSTPATLGEFEQLVLLAILRLGENAYGVTIRREISTRTKRETTPGALYTTLDRLEDKGLLRSSMGDPTPERGGRAKRIVTLTAPGKRAAAEFYTTITTVTEGIAWSGSI